MSDSVIAKLNGSLQEFYTLLHRASLLGSGLFYRTSIAALIMTSLIVELSEHLCKGE